MDQYDNTVGLEFDLDLLVPELAARGTCRGEFATRGTQVFRVCSKIFYLSYPAIQISSLKFHAQLEINVIFFITKLVQLYTFKPIIIIIMFVIENVYLLLKIPKLFVKSINLLRNGEKTSDRYLCSDNY